MIPKDFDGKQRNHLSRVGIRSKEFKYLPLANSYFLSRTAINLESTEVAMNGLVDRRGTLEGQIVQKHAVVGFSSWQ